MTFRAGFSLADFRSIFRPEMDGKLQSVRRKELIFYHILSSRAQLSKNDISRHFLESSKYRNFSSRSSGFSNFQVRILKKVLRARFKTAKNPTSRRPSESTQEALNSLLMHCLGRFDRFSPISAKRPPRGTDAKTPL